MVVELLSDVVVRDDFGSISGNVKHLSNAFTKILSFNNRRVYYTKTITGGGFNAKWRLPIRQYTAFCKGSVIELHGCEAGKQVAETGYMKDICFGGYGRYRIRPKSKINTYEYEKTASSLAPQTESCDPNTFDSATKGIIKKVVLNQLKLLYTAEALKAANSSPVLTLSQTAAMRIQTRWRALDGAKDAKTQLLGYFKCNNNENAKDANGEDKAIDELGKLVRSIHNNYKDVDAPSNIFADEVAQEHDDILFDVFIKAYLNQMKRDYRNRKRGS
jgi:hypothetical protein